MRLLILLIAFTALIACSGSAGLSSTSNATPTLTDQNPSPTALDQNLAPTLLEQNIGDLYFSNLVVGNIDFTDNDSLATDIVLTVTTAPTHGSVTITNHATGDFSYVPSSTNALLGDSFQVKVGDGEAESASQTMTLSFSDSTGPSLTLSPDHNAENVALNSRLIVNSDDALDASSLTYNSSAGACLGSLQISKDSFSNCVAIQSVAASSLDRTFTITLLADLDGLSTYEFKATTDVKNTFNVSPASDTSHSFTTVNIAPTLLDQNFADLYFTSSVLGNIAFTDNDSLGTDIVFTVTTAPTHGSITITNHATGAFSYAPSSTSALSGDGFQVKVGDGQDESASQTMALSFSDSTGPSLTLSPNHNANNVASNTSLTVTSNDALDVSSLTYNSGAGACTGSLQISSDSFSNCVAIQSVTASSLDRTFTIALLVDLDGQSTYEFKATTDIKNTFNVAQASDTTHSFTTARTALIVTEIGSAYYSNVLRWFEIYNPSSSAVDLSDFSFKSKYFNSADSLAYAAHTFALPSITVQPGQYVVVRAQDQTQTYASNNRVVHIKDGTYYPYWTSIGYIDLIENSGGTSVDFVTFGSSATPTTGSAWSGTFVAGMPSAADSYGKGIMRDALLTDSDDATDWQAMDWTTPGGANDVTCNTDADNDGIPDCSEVSGSTFAGLPLYDWGARTGQRDIFIEVDYMDATNGGGQAADEGIIPQKAALQMVVDSFASQGIAIHFDVGNLHDNASGLDPIDFDLGGGEEVPYFDGVTFDPADARANLYDYKRDYMDYNRLQIFHYLLFANSQNLNGSAGSSGLAEINANDLIVSVGNWSLSNSSTANTNRLVNYQASTIMHELGHNLGLLHGGDENNNYKPNYISIMNYLYQLDGLPTIGSDEGDRVYYSSNFHSQSGTCYSGLSNSSTTSTFKMNYSHGNAVSFNFAAINETLGLGQTGSGNVDYDCDGNDTETSVTMPDGNGDLSGTITDYNDWGNINLLFQRGFSGSNTGSFLVYSASNAPDESELAIERVGDDRAPIADEYSPSADFFKALHAH